ncbi:Hypothetical protein UVM_LOCUS318, partial [uncultured virus]
VLAALEAAQLAVGFTHYDLHANNVMLEAAPTPLGSSGLLYVYDLVESAAPRVVPMQGWRAVLIDFEYAHVDGLDGTPFDSSLDCLPLGYDPSSRDRSYDVLHFLIGTLNYHATLHSDRMTAHIARELCRETNASDRGVAEAAELRIGKDGVFACAPDWLLHGVMDHPSVQRLPAEDRFFIEQNFYRFVNLMFHRTTRPFRERVETANNATVARVLVLLMECEVAVPQHRLTVLYELVSGAGQASLVRTLRRLNVRHSNHAYWLPSLQRAVDEALPHLETAACRAVRENRARRERQREGRFSPSAAREWLQQHYPLAYDVDRTTVVRWMRASDAGAHGNDDGSCTVSFRHASDDELARVNSERNLDQKALLLRRILHRVAAAASQPSQPAYAHLDQAAVLSSQVSM